MSIQNMKRSETTEQIALFNWAKRTESILPELALMYHVPNEGKRSNGGILKAAGLKKRRARIYAYPLQITAFTGCISN